LKLFSKTSSLRFPKSPVLYWFFDSGFFFCFQKPTTSSCLILNILKPEPEVINKIKHPPNTTFRHFIVKGNPALLWCSIVQRLVEICPIRISFDPCLQCSLESKVSIETCTPVSVWTLWRLLLFTFCQSLKTNYSLLGAAVRLTCGKKDPAIYEDGVKNWLMESWRKEIELIVDLASQLSPTLALWSFVGSRYK
jgi:hypothetical protein